MVVRPQFWAVGAGARTSEGRSVFEHDEKWGIPKGKRVILELILVIIAVIGVITTVFIVSITLVPVIAKFYAPEQLRQMISRANSGSSVTIENGGWHQ
jgi:hypothetical protein